MDPFDMVGFVFAIIALSVARSAKAEIAALKNEVETLKAAQQARSSDPN